MDIAQVIDFYPKTNAYKGGVMESINTRIDLENNPPQGHESYSQLKYYFNSPHAKPKHNAKSE